MNTPPLRRQRILFSVLFLMGANLLLGGSYRAKNDSWISLLVAIALLLLWGLILARISVLYPEKDIFDLLHLFPKIPRKILTVFLIVYCFGQSAVTVRTYAGFAHMVSLQNTDLFFPVAMFSLAMIFFLRNDTTVLLRYSYVATIPVILIIILLFFILFSGFRGELLYPIAYKNGTEIAAGAIENLSFPFGNAFLLLGILSERSAPNKTYGSWFVSCSVAGILSLLIMFQNLLLLGGELASNLNFPYNFSTSLVNVADFFSRLEVFASLFFFLSAVARSAFCLKLSEKGLATLFSIEEKTISVPFIAFFCGYCLIMFKNTNTVFNYLEIFPIFSIPLQFILPILLWLLAERKKEKNKDSQVNQTDDVQHKTKSLQK